ncbi:unnamed protein product [Ectocarpus sp. 12 AP-2014]
MTADACLALCADSAYYGTQYSEECWCGAEGAEYDANGEGDCTMRCTGDTAEICGGYNAMSVYEINSDDGETDDVDGGEIDDPSYLGCYSDPADNRVFVQDISSAAMTAEACSEACAGSAYYGTQYSTECWCGAEGADYDANGAGVCDMPCGGDADEICGGFYAMSVYENDVDDGETEDPSYLGCYSDPADSRVFVQDISSAAMTAEICSEACAGSAYYGTQYSTEVRQTDIPSCRAEFSYSSDNILSCCACPCDSDETSCLNASGDGSHQYTKHTESAHPYVGDAFVATCEPHLQIYAGAAPKALTTMPTARVSATCLAAVTPTRSAEVSTPSRSTRTARTTGSPWSSRAPAMRECRPALPAAKPTAALAEARVAAPAAPAPLRAAPRASSPLASFAPTPGPPRASSKLLPSLSTNLVVTTSLPLWPRTFPPLPCLDLWLVSPHVVPRIAHLGHHALPTNRAMVALLLHQS